MTMLSDIPNIIIFGESGSGKSSVVNMLAGMPVADTSNSVSGCTFDSCAYDINVRGKIMRLWDTAGLDEGESGRVPHSESVVKLYKLIQGLSSNGVNLLMFVMRPRLRESTLNNWKLFHKIICQEKVPIVTVVTNLEQEDDMDQWWWRNKDELDRRYGIVPDDYACITAVRGKRMPTGAHTLDKEFETSTKMVQRAMRSSCLENAWQVSAPEWFKTIVTTAYETRMCRSRRPIERRERVIGGEAFERLVVIMGERQARILVEEFLEE
ncbi:P-loop containing nucleoside triphosphate hydrolase protein [Macrolepiota fuliginosa MF-IS2]|uniref:P-loop containing nucleoside triphosphate hydrolase protein n=1 Tax=Macrolepiota fuliginosa MF-IS2 TaxID=1400762 RepID=A0A9P6BV75_9AGAR|nr:P-loop containing nucleoside triphosphate hydrolase protein [Macrolepiota fuliginosa MF-IS2]